MNEQFTLKNIIKLSSKVTVYVPSTMNISENIDNTKYVDECATLLANCFGGATSTKTLGYWTSPKEGLVKEETTMVFAYCTTEQAEKHMDKVYRFCLKLKEELKQDAVALEYNGEMFLL